MRYLLEVYLSAMEWVWFGGLPVAVVQPSEHERELAEWDAEFNQGTGGKRAA